jgi:hypothetical protein
LLLVRAVKVADAMQDKKYDGKPEHFALTQVLEERFKIGRKQPANA